MSVSERADRIEIQGVELHLAHPDELPLTWIGQEECLKQLLAAWMIVQPGDVPMNPRLIGKPGVGKTTLAYAGGKAPGTGRLHLPRPPWTPGPRTC